MPLIPLNYNNMCVIEFQRRQGNNLTLWLELISGFKLLQLVLE